MEKIAESINRQEVAGISRANAEPKWLCDFRQSSLDDFEKLPVEKSELFRKYANIGEIRWEKFKLERGKSAKTEKIGEGIVFESINSAIQNHPDILREYFAGKVTKQADSKFAALANAIFSTGVLIKIPKNARLKAPIRLRSTIRQNGSISASKNIIILEKGSSATIIEENYSENGKGTGAVYLSQADFHIKEGAQLTFGAISSFGGGAVFVSQKKALLENGARANFSGGFFGGALMISSLENVLKGNGCQAEDFEVILGSGSGKFAITSDLTHLGRDTKGKVAVKGAFRDGSKGLFKGMARIGKDAKNASSFIAGHSILLSENASSDAIPGLQIENNDVKATHSASVAQIDEEQLFYLLCRGIPREKAKKMVVEGFLAPVIKQMHLRDVEIRLKALFELEWGGLGMEGLEAKMNEIEADMPPESADGKDIFEGHYKYR